MADEIERRFLVAEDFNPEDHTRDKSYMSQSYLEKTGDWIIRVRKVETYGTTVYFLTMKSFISEMTNREIEIEIDEETYLDFMKSCSSTVEKTRYYFNVEDRLWEVDVFKKEDVIPKIIAEVELDSEEDVLVLPSWVTKEVTGDRWYSNQQIAQRIRNREIS